MYTSTTNNDSFLMLRCYWDHFNLLKEHDPKCAIAFLEAIMDYGFDRKKPDKDSPLWVYGLAPTFDIIDSTYEKEAKKWRQVLEDEDL